MFLFSFLYYSVLYIFYHNYIVLNDHETIIIIANIVWSFIGLNFIMLVLYRVLYEKGNSIHNIISWLYFYKVEYMDDILQNYNNNRSLLYKNYLEYILKVKIVSIYIYIYYIINNYYNKAFDDLKILKVKMNLFISLLKKKRLSKKIFYMIKYLRYLYKDKYLGRGINKNRVFKKNEKKIKKAKIQDIKIKR